MVEACAILEGSKLAGGLVDDGRVVRGIASMATEGQIAQVDASKVSQLAILRQQQRSTDLGRHFLVSLDGYLEGSSLE